MRVRVDGMRARAKLTDELQTMTASSVLSVVVLRGGEVLELADTMGRLTAP